jgi:glycosyltransferase involved in cell wall biosynthesis
MEALCSSLGVGNRVRFLGVRNDLTDLYRAADVLIQMSAYETFSLVLVEAALSGLALVSTDVGVATWLCGEDQSGGLLIERSSEALAAGVAFVMEHQEVSRNRAEVAERRAQRFTLNHLVDQVEKVYEQILDAQ